VIAREGLDCKMYPLVSLQVVIAVEALRALVALERSVVGGRLLVLRMAHEVWHLCSVSTVESRHHRMSSDERKPPVRVLNVREDGWLTTRVLERRPLLILVRRVGWVV